MRVYLPSDHKHTIAVPREQQQTGGCLSPSRDVDAKQTERTLRSCKMLRVTAMPLCWVSFAASVIVNCEFVRRAGAHI